MLPQITGWYVSYNPHLMPPASSGPHWGTTYHTWCTLYSWLQVHWGAVSVFKVAPSLWMPMRGISKLEGIKAYILGRAKDFEKRAMLEARRCRLWDQVHWRYLRKYVIQDILKVLKLTMIKHRMFAVLMILTPGCRNKFVHYRSAKFDIAVLPLMDVNTCLNSTLQTLQWCYRLREFTQKWLQKPKYSDFRPLSTTGDAWTIVNYVMEVLRLWTLWM